MAVCSYEIYVGKTCEPHKTDVSTYAKIFSMAQRRTVLGNLGFKSLMHRAGYFALDQLYPPTCISCETANMGGAGSKNLLCGRCWAKLRPITPPLCPKLGLPFEYDMGADGLSAQAIAHPPPYNRARSAFVHMGVAKKLVSRLKFGDRPDLSEFCASLMALAGKELFEETEEFGQPVLVPVPLHRGRQWQRRYNQSNELAKALGKLVGLEVDPLIVRRVKKTRPQIGLSGEQRARNVSGAFLAEPNILERLGGRRVLIVDDVITTGSTINALSKALLKAHVAHIDVISFSRVVIGIDDSL